MLVCVHFVSGRLLHWAGNRKGLTGRRRSRCYWGAWSEEMSSVGGSDVDTCVEGERALLGRPDRNHVHQPRVVGGEGTEHSPGCPSPARRGVRRGWGWVLCAIFVFRRQPPQK